jgi:hypothetical protein
MDSIGEHMGIASRWAQDRHETNKGVDGRGMEVFSCKFHLASSTLAQPHRKHIEVMWWDLDLYSGATIFEEPKWSLF